MASEEGQEGKNLALEMKKKESKKEMLNKIINIQDRIRLEKGNENINVKYYEKCQLQIGEKILEVSVAEIEETQIEKTQEEKEEQEKIKTYELYIKYKGEDLMIAQIDEKGNLILMPENLKIIDPENKLQLQSGEKVNLENLKEIEGKTEKDLSEEIEKDEKKESKEEIAKEQIAKQQGIEKDKIVGLVEIDLNRKITQRESFKQIVPNTNQYTNVYVVPR